MVNGDPAFPTVHFHFLLPLPQHNPNDSIPQESTPVCWKTHPLNNSNFWFHYISSPLKSGNSARNSFKCLSTRISKYASFLNSIIQLANLSTEYGQTQRYSRFFYLLHILLRLILIDIHKSQIQISHF